MITRISFPEDLFDSIYGPNRKSFDLDIKETENNYTVEANLPGFKKDEVSIELHNGKLTISVNRKETENKNEENYVYRERKFYSSKRTVNLPDSDSEKVKAKLEDGVLTIKVDKKEKTSNKIVIE